MLTDLAIKKAKPQEKDYKLFDALGLFLLVRKTGSRLWRFKYRMNGKEKLLALGSYPQLSLSDARQARDEARRNLAAGVDPSLLKMQQKLKNQENSEHGFEKITRKWWELNRDRWTARHAEDVLHSLEKRIFPEIGRLTIQEIDTPLLLGVLQKLEKTGAIETTHRIRQRLESVFNYAISTGLIKDNPASVLKGALKPVPKKRHQPAVIDLNALREVLVRTTETPAHPVTKLALRFLSLTVVRPGEVRAMVWEEVRDGIWEIPAERMKMKRPHRVVLSRQAMEVLAVVRQLTGRGTFVFPNSRNSFRPMSENAMGYLLNRAGFRDIQVPHGFRASFSSIMNERFPQDRAVIDLMLAHLPANAVEAAYNRAEHLERRKELYQIWADLVYEGVGSAEDILTLSRR